MIKKIIVILAALLVSSLAQATPTYILPDDTIIFRSDFGGASATGFIQSVMLHEGKYIPIYIDSPGGSVFALDQMISAVRATGKKTVCFVGFAASAAFMFTHAVCDIRVVQPFSVLMSHQAATAYRGEVNRIESFKKLIDGMLLRLDNIVSKRLGLSVAELREKSSDEWWVSGADSVKEGLADKVANLKCSPAMLGRSYTESLQMFGFTLELVWSTCPLLPYPLSVNGNPTFSTPLPVSPNSRERFEAHKEFYINMGTSKE